MSSNVYAIILAAGASSRLGRPKQLLRWQNRSLLELTVANATSLLPERVFVVLGAHAEAIHNTTALGHVRVIHNPNWREGIASSIRTGIRALPKSADAALMLLCDQPLLGREHLQTLLDAWHREPTRIIASRYHQMPGVPALFPASYFNELLTLAGDQGAKRLLLKYSRSLLQLSLREAELDIDTLDDFNHLIEHDCADK